MGFIKTLLKFNDEINGLRLLYSTLEAEINKNQQFHFLGFNLIFFLLVLKKKKNLHVRKKNPCFIVLAGGKIPEIENPQKYAIFKN